MAETEVTVRTHSRNIVGLSQREEGRERGRGEEGGSSSVGGG